MLISHRSAAIASSKCFTSVFQAHSSMIPNTQKTLSSSGMISNNFALLRCHTQGAHRHICSQPQVFQPPHLARQRRLSATPPSTTCTGQLVQPTTFSTCKSISQEYNAPDGHAAAVIGTGWCEFRDEQPVYLPLPCELYTVDKYGETCDTIIEKISTPENPVLLAQFLAWNPFIIGSCDHV